MVSLCSSRRKPRLPRTCSSTPAPNHCGSCSFIAAAVQRYAIRLKRDATVWLPYIFSAAKARVGRGVAASCHEVVLDPLLPHGTASTLQAPLLHNAGSLSFTNHESGSVRDMVCEANGMLSFGNCSNSLNRRQTRLGGLQVTPGIFPSVVMRRTLKMDVS